MKKKEINITIDTDSMLHFFKNAPSWGTHDKPMIADNFSKTDAPEVLWKQGNILKLENNAHYEISLSAKNKKIPIQLLGRNSVLQKADSESSGNADIELVMIKDTLKPAEKEIEEWEQIIDMEKSKAHYHFNGVLFISKSKEENFNIYTAKEISCYYNLQYAIRFSIATKDDEGNSIIKIAVIDPFISNTTDEPD